MSNVYLEKIAAFQFPKSISRYARSRARLEDKSPFFGGPVHQIREFVNTARGKGFHNRRADDALKNYGDSAKAFHSQEHNYARKEYYNAKDHASVTGKMPDMSSEQQANYKFMDDLATKQSKSIKDALRESRAAGLATTGARKTIKVVGGTVAAVGGTGVIVHNMPKDKN